MRNQNLVKILIACSSAGFVQVLVRVLSAWLKRRRMLTAQPAKTLAPTPSALPVHLQARVDLQRRLEAAPSEAVATPVAIWTLPPVVAQRQARRDEILRQLEDADRRGLADALAHWLEQAEGEAFDSPAVLRAERRLRDLRAREHEAGESAAAEQHLKQETARQQHAVAESAAAEKLLNQEMARRQHAEHEAAESAAAEQLLNQEMARQQHAVAESAAAEKLLSQEMAQRQHEVAESAAAERLLNQEIARRQHAVDESPRATPVPQPELVPEPLPELDLPKEGKAPVCLTIGDRVRCTAPFETLGNTPKEIAVRVGDCGRVRRMDTDGSAGVLFDKDASRDYWIWRSDWHNFCTETVTPVTSPSKADVQQVWSAPELDAKACEALRAATGWTMEDALSLWSAEAQRFYLDAQIAAINVSETGAVTSVMFRFDAGRKGKLVLLQEFGKLVKHGETTPDPDELPVTGHGLLGKLDVRGHDIFGRGGDGDWGEPDIHTVVVDVMRHSAAKGPKSATDATSRSIYEWMGIHNDAVYGTMHPRMKALQATNALQVSYGAKTGVDKKCIHVVCPSLSEKKGGLGIGKKSIGRDRAVVLLSHAYASVFKQFAEGGERSLRLQVIGDTADCPADIREDMIEITLEAAQRGFGNLSRAEKDRLMKARDLQLCVLSDHAVPQWEDAMKELPSQHMNTIILPNSED